MSAKEAFLETYDREHATTMRVLRAYPADQADLKPGERSNSARQIAWIFVLENYLGQKIWNDEFKNGVTPGNPPKAPQNWSEIVEATEKAAGEFRALVDGASPEELAQKVHFMVAPKTLGEMTRSDVMWFLLHDQIHHRGQLSVYLRIAGGKVPSIYGPSGDEPWF